MYLDQMPNQIKSCHPIIHTNSRSCLINNEILDPDCLLDAVYDSEWIQGIG